MNGRRGALSRGETSGTLQSARAMWKSAVDATGKAIRSLGQSLDRAGVALEGPFTYTEHRMRCDWRWSRNGGVTS